MPGAETREGDLEQGQLVDQARRQIGVFLEGHGDILLDGQRAEQCPVLEHHADAPTQRRERVLADGQDVDP